MAIERLSIFDLIDSLAKPLLPGFSGPERDGPGQKGTRATY